MELLALRPVRIARRIRAITAVLALSMAQALLAPAGSSAVRIAQHPIPKLTSGEVVSPASTIFSGPQGLLIAGARKSAYQTVTTAPTFAVSAGAGGATAVSFFLGPDGQTWLISRLSEASSATRESTSYATLDELTPGSSTLRFRYPTAGSTPLTAVTGPDGAVWLPETTQSTVDRIAAGGVESFPMPFGNSAPLQIVSGPGGNLWTTNLVDGAIAEIAPNGTITEHRLPGTGLGAFGNAEPSGLAVGPDGAVWFAEQNAAAIGRITAAGEIETFSIPAAAGAFPGSIGYPQPRDVTVGPEGGIWFTDPGTNSVGRVLGGHVSEFAIGSNWVVPDTIVAAGGELWFNEENASALGSVDPVAPPTGAATHSTARVTSREVARMLSVPRKRAHALDLLRHGGYTATTSLPAAGVVTISWSTKKHVTVAAGRETLSAAGVVKLEVKLTAAGKKLMKKTKPLELTARGRATLDGASPVSATKSLTIKQ